MKRGKGMRGRVVAGLLALVASSLARADEGLVNSAAGTGSAPDRVQKARAGPGNADQIRRFADPDPMIRIAALKGLADEGDPQGKDLALQALDDPDPRVQIKGLDCLVQLRAKDAAPALTQRMFLKGSSVPLRKRILVTLGILGDPETARQLVDYASAEQDRDLRGSAIVAAGRLADPSTVPSLTTFVEREKDPAVQRVAREILVRLTPDHAH